MKSSSNISGINFRIVIPVALMSAASLVLAFMPQHKGEAVTMPQVAVVEDSFNEDDAAYYEQVAEEFMAMLPGDKMVVAKLIDEQNHHIIYYETTECPSCYCYDLETQNTSVLFGSEDGFYIDTKLLILGRITDCRIVGDSAAGTTASSLANNPRAVFIATNRAPEVSYENAVHAFELNLVDHSMKYIATGANAYFTSDTQLVVSRAQLLYRSLFTDEDVYTTAPTVYDL